MSGVKTSRRVATARPEAPTPGGITSGCDKPAAPSPANATDTRLPVRGCTSKSVTSRARRSASTLSAMRCATWRGSSEWARAWLTEASASALRRRRSVSAKSRTLSMARAAWVVRTPRASSVPGLGRRGRRLKTASTPTRAWRAASGTPTNMRTPSACRKLVSRARGSAAGFSTMTTSRAKPAEPTNPSPTARVVARPVQGRFSTPAAARSTRRSSCWTQMRARLSGTSSAAARLAAASTSPSPSEVVIARATRGRRPRSSDTLALAMSRSSLTDRRPGVKTTSVTPV
jgi:hypothetical protein